MQPEHWRRIQTIFADALEYNTADRSAFVGSVCTHDDKLRGEVESLLEAHGGAPGFMEGSALDLVQSAVADEPVSGFRVGAYLVVREIGRGGMGSVYLAERADDQYQMRVAIKIVTRGVDTDFIVRRFRHERQILAGLDHPNIARLFEGGTTDDGLPYFVMEYIEGEPITRYCDTHQLSMGDRLGLFRSVCAAVHNAHQHLIVHRDIKPGNILVTMAGVPKLLDFGIATLLNAREDDETSGAAVSTRAMTIEYASPEQLRGSAVTTLTDVYSLGVVLYQLLAGRMPFAESTPCAPHEIARIRTTNPPQPPSMVVQREGGRHSFDTVKRARALRGDLDAIVLKAMHADPGRRYPSAQQLSDDIRRYLGKHPVIAQRSTLVYRARKAILRNALASAAAVILFLALVGGITATSWQARVAEQQRSSAEHRFEQVRRLAMSLISEVNDSIAGLPGTTRARRVIVVRALGALDSLAHGADGERGLEYDLAEAYIKVGDVQGQPYRPNLGETRAALESYSKARLILATVLASHPRDMIARENLVGAYEKIAAIYLRSRDWVQGERYDRLAVALSDTLLRSNPTNDAYQRDLSAALLYLGDALAASDDQWSAERVRAARDSYSRSLAISRRLAAHGPASPATRHGLMMAYNRMGYAGSSLWKLTGDVAELRGSLANHLQAQRLRLELLSMDPESAENSRLVADGWMDIAQVRQELGDVPGALASFDSAGPLFRALVDIDHANVEARRDLAYFHENIGGTLVHAGRPAAGIQHERTAVTMLLALQRADAASNEEYFHLSHARQTLARAFELQGATTQALGAYRDVIITLQRWLTTEPNNARALRLVAEAQTHIASLERAPK